MDEWHADNVFHLAILLFIDYDLGTMKVAYIGNFIPEHSTENHVRLAWQDTGHQVHTVQEGDPDAWEALIADIRNVDLILWTRTADLAAQIGHRTQLRLLSTAKSVGVPTVAFHLDRWWGLNREASVWEEPFFRCQYVITADGGHQDEFASVGVNHFWLPPAVSRRETVLGHVNPEYKSELAFVGSWLPGYHAEWTHRPELIQFLQENFRGRIQFWPKQGQPGVRGEALRDLYMSVGIVIGDSCLVGGVTHYWSDRIPETVGRGGFLVHPYVKGLEEHFDIGKHLDVWPVGDWVALQGKIAHYRNNLEEAHAIAVAGRDHVRANHTYDVRVNQILEIANK